jgi:hypothetical protein
LHPLQSTPRITPVRWQWSIDGRRTRPERVTVSAEPQIEQ